MLYIHASFLIILAIMLMVSLKSIFIIKYAAYIFLIRIYIALFQKNKIFENADDALFLFFNMMLNIIMLLTQILLIGKICLKNYNLIFYLTNGTIILIGMLNKIIGFEEAWERRKKIYINMIMTIIGLLWLSYLFTQNQKCET